MTEANEHSFNQPAARISFEERFEEPNWTLIDEISLPLLEQGIGSFDVLQQSLRSVALCRIDETDEEGFSRQRLIKLMRLAQFQIEYLLKSQAFILERLEASYKECQAAKVTASALKKQMKATRHHCENVIASASANNPVFECASCGKVFLSAEYLASHINRHHRSNTNVDERISDEENFDFAEGSEKLSKVLLAISDLREELVHHDHPSITASFAAMHSPSLLTLNSAVAERLERLELATDRILTEVISGKQRPSSIAAPIELSQRIIPSPSPVPPETESGSILLTAERNPNQKLSESQTNIYESISPEVGGQLNQSVGSADTSVWGSSMDSAHGLR